MIKRVMISQPMKGISEGKIKKTRREAAEKLEKEGYEVVQSYFTEEWIRLNAGGIKNKALWCLAKSLEVMSHCDTVYFCDGWQEARGCRIEHEAAVAYGLEVYEELSFPRSHENDVKIPVISMEDVPKVMEEMENEHRTDRC
jgi:hypothetical protein